MEKTLPHLITLYIKGIEDAKIKLKFLDTNIAQKVFAKIQNAIRQNATIGSRVFNYPFSGKSWDASEVKVYELALKGIIEDLNNRTYIRFPLLPEDISFFPNSMQSRFLLNSLHRYFTSCQETNFTSWDKINLSPKGKLCHHDEESKVRELVYLINFIVHKMDPFYYTKEFNTRTHKGIMLHEFNTYFEGINQMEFIEIEDKITRTKDTNDYTVWLPLDRMRGKNLFDCYFDFDNPANSDIENENTYDGSFSLGYRKGFYDPDLNDWLKVYNVERTVGIPLGYIIEGENFLEFLYPDCISSIEITENFFN